MKKILYIFLAAALCTLWSCDKDNDGDKTAPKTTVAFTQSGGQIVEVDINTFPVSYTYSLTLDKPSDKVFICDLEVDMGLVEAYNAAHGTNYEPMPEGTYQLPVTTSIIMPGKTQSYDFEVSFVSLYGCQKDKTYLLPVVAKPINGEEFAADQTNVIYIKAPITRVVDYIKGLDMHTYSTDMYRELSIPNSEVVSMGDNTHTFEIMIYPYTWRATTNYIGTWRGKDTGNNNENFSGCEVRVGSVAGASNIGNRQADLTLTAQGKIIPAREWTVISIVCDGTQTGQSANAAYWTYFNGELISSAKPTKRFGPTSSQRFKVGYTLTGFQFGNTTASNYFDGVIGEVRIWKGALTQEQIRANLRTVANPSATAMYAYWKMDDGEGNVIRDHSGNGRDLTFPAASKVKWTAEMNTFPVN